MNYFSEVGCGFSVFLNTICGGSYKETLSARLRLMKLKYANNIPWSKPISKIFIWIIDVIAPNHLK